MRHRVVEPEILDSLAEDDPAAVASRRDIRLFNHLMGNFRWMARQLAALPCRSPLTELAAGDGSMGQHLLRRGILSPEDACSGVDLAGRPADWPATWEWSQCDLTDYRFDDSCRVLTGNLILHQLSDAELAHLGARIRASAIRHVLACEPARSRLSLLFIPLCRLLGMHQVTLHDALVSVRAGFRGTELADLLGLRAAGWEVRCTRGLLGSIRLKASRP
jgi:hypothetical protein